MDTRWRNRLAVFIYALLFIIGLSGPLTLISMGGNYMHRDYYHSPEFRSQLDQFAHYLNQFELNAISFEDAKARITVSEDEISQYRIGLGTLTDNMTTIKEQYAFRIEEALAADNQEAADFYTAERDRRIEEVTKGFKDDEYVKTVLVKDKEQRIDNYYEDRERYRAEYVNYRKKFDYYFTNSLNGKVFTNLGVLEERSADRMMNVKLFTTPYTISSDDSFQHWISDLFNQSFATYEGRIAVSNTSPIVIEADRYRQVQIVLMVYTLASIAALLVFFYRIKKTKGLPIDQGRWAHYYSKLPIDARGLLLLATGLGAIGLLLTFSYQFHAVFDQPWSNGRKLAIITVIAAVCWALTMVQGQLLAAGRQDPGSFKREWEHALLNMACKSTRLFAAHIIGSVKDAFLIKSIVTQLVILLLVVFGLGAAGNLMFFGSRMTLEPVSTILYIVLLIFVGLPIILLLINKVAYFNRIVKAADELAAGSLAEELPVKGKTALTGLAANINVLKSGVKTLQNEQARSERLKTELITNVSHDLRTPLTSIITYTGLLKAEDVSSEERLAYIDIIDKKSMRLKVLIDDLFEVSKMASGNVELTLARADLVQLLQQALAEYDNAIEGSTVQFRVTTPEMPVYACVDGQKLWRMFDNLIGNMMKYSLDHSRAYITISIEDHKQVLVTFKNVSKYEYSENGEELLERFKRGDTSRHTEGSGLGLAIAKSIVDLHDGRMSIETDGDLFKVIVALKVEP